MMEEVKRVEIVVDALHFDDVVEAIEGVGLKGWTRIRGVLGSGERGMQYADELTRVSDNNLLLTTCRPDQLDALEEALRPLLKRYGGVCLVSDARWLVR